MDNLRATLERRDVRAAAAGMAIDAANLGLFSSRCEALEDHSDSGSCYAAILLFAACAVSAACGELGVDPHAALSEVMLGGPVEPPEDERQAALSL